MELGFDLRNKGPIGTYWDLSDLLRNKGPIVSMLHARYCSPVDLSLHVKGFLLSSKICSFFVEDHDNQLMTMMEKCLFD